MQTFSTPAEAWQQWTRADAKKLRASMYMTKEGRFVVYVVSSNLIPPGAKRMKPQPPYPSTDPRAGTREALGKVEARHTGAVHDACVAAVEIAKRKLTVHSREVREAMLANGTLDPAGGPEHWLGAALNRLSREGVLERSGHSYKYTDAERGIHERTVTVWQLKEGADTTKYEPATA